MIAQEYYDWLISKVTEYNNNYDYLLQHLYSIDFYSCIPLDDNRLTDGGDLWCRFADEQGYSYNEMDSIAESQVTVLEVMIGLAVRMEDTIMCDVDFGDRTALWFWAMVKSMGLYSMIDENYDSAYVDDVVNDMLERNYDKDGRGSLFHVKGTMYDMRELEIWRQMHVFIGDLM